MANWKKVVVSGSSAELAGLTVDGTAIVGDLTGDVTGDVTGNVSGTAGSTTGNAGTATALETARTINGVSFDGTANITVTAAGSTLSDTVPTTKGGTGLTTIGSALTVLRVNAAGNGLEYGAASEGDVTGVVSSTTNQLVVTDPTGPEPSLAIQTAAIADAGTGLATADQIHTFVTTQTDTMAAGTTGNAATATNATNAADSALLNGEAKAAMFTSPAFTGTATAAALNVTGNTVIAGDLTVQGTASFESTENLLVKDRFIGLASGSAGAADGGIVIEQSNVDGGKGAVFAFDGLSTGRWGVDLDFNPTASAYTPAAFMSNVVVGSDDTVPTGTYAKKGNIFIGSSENEIWIYGS